MGKRATSAINQTLTNYAQGIAQDLRSALAEFLAPTVRVAASIGQFKKFDGKNAFQIYTTARAVGGTATRIKFEATDPTYNCLPQALEVAIDDSERDSAGADQLGLEQQKVSTLISSATIAHEDQVLTLLNSGLTAVAGKGVWSGADIDPVKELDEQIQAIALATGMMPNAMAFGLGAWQVFRNHPKVIARQPGAALVGITAQQAAAMTINPGMEIRVGVLSKDQAKFGNTKNATSIVGANVYLLIRSPNPTTYDPSFAKTFMAGTGGITAVREYRDESARSDVYAIDRARDIQVVSTECARRLAIS
ncbi:MAG: hypothetical protein V1929_00295 [bacterium]